MKRSVILAALWLGGTCCSIGDSGVTFVPAPFSDLINLSGATPEEESYDPESPWDLDSADQPRLAFRRTGPGVDGIFFMRRRADGTWTIPLQVSDDNSDASVKSEPLVRVSRNNDFSHIFWFEAGAVHYARMNDADPPGADLPDVVISDTLPENVPGGAVTLASVASEGLTVTIDRTANNVFAAWAEKVNKAGGTTADETVIVGTVLGGTGAYGEHFAVLEPDGGATAADVVTTSDPPIVLKVAGDGTLHVMWVSSTAGGSAKAVRHRTRTGPGTYSGGGTGDVVSDTTGQSYRFMKLLLAPDGDAYAVWAQSLLPVREIHAAYRAAGAASTFVASAPLDPDPGTAPDEVVGLGAALDSAETPHVFFKRASGELLEVSHAAFSSNPTAGWGNVTAAKETLGTIWFAGSNVGRVRGHIDASDQAVIVWDGPLVAGSGAFEVLAAVRPAGGAFGAVLNLTSTSTDSRLDVIASRANGDAFLVLREGPTGLREIHGVDYFSGGSFGPPLDISQSPGIDSHGSAEPAAVGLLLSGTAGVAVLFREHTGPLTHDLYFNRD